MTSAVPKMSSGTSRIEEPYPIYQPSIALPWRTGLDDLNDPVITFQYYNYSLHIRNLPSLVLNLPKWQEIQSHILGSFTKEGYAAGIMKSIFWMKHTYAYSFPFVDRCWRQGNSIQRVSFKSRLRSMCIGRMRVALWLWAGDRHRGRSTSFFQPSFWHNFRLWWLLQYQYCTICELPRLKKGSTPKPRPPAIDVMVGMTVSEDSLLDTKEWIHH